MISGLIDELNKSADEWNDSNMFELARMCREAADTIWELRDDLQRANAENAKLREQSERLFDKTLELATENSKLRELCKLCEREAENAKLREQMERLVTLLRVDCDIDASWDGLRRFWSIELTEGGCLMRDRACKAEAENAKLLELLQRLLVEYRYLRVRPRKTYLQHEARMRAIEKEMRDLGVEVDG